MQSLLPQSSRCASPQGRSRFRTPRSAGGTGGVSPRHRGGPRSGPPGGPTARRLEPSRRIPIQNRRAFYDPCQSLGGSAAGKQRSSRRQLSALWARDGPRRVSWLTCHEVQRECGTRPQSLHGALLSSQRHRVRCSDVACLGAASAKTISRGPSPSHCPTEPRRRHSAPAAVLKCGHARSTGTYPISAQ
jgi:hypothetical protein